MRKLQRATSALASAVLVALALALIAAKAAPHAGSRASAVDRTESRTLPGASSRAAVPGRAFASWCGAATQTDQSPNVVAGHAVHWIYAIPSDGADRFSTFASTMESDAEDIDGWWRGQDPTRAPRNDLAQFTCGVQLDLSTIRLSLSSAQLSSVESRFGPIVGALAALGFDSGFTKYVIYYDGPVEPEFCGQGGSIQSGAGFAVVYVQACAGVPLATTAAHELIHTLGAVPVGAPHMCDEPDALHVCDSEQDMMYPYGDETPLFGLSLDSGRDDYYGHSGSWPDVQDSPWLVWLDQQRPFALAVTGPGSVTADVPGLKCTQSCTTAWNPGTALGLTATPGPGAKLVRWGGACSGRLDCHVTVGQGVTASALFAPVTYRLAVRIRGKGVVRISNGRISCPARCSAQLSSYVAAHLTVKPTKGWRFKAWQGACRGARPTCTVPMTSDTSARAVFVRT